MMFGFRRGKRKTGEVLASPLRRDDEVTVRNGPTQHCLVNTAMATHIGTRAYQQDAAYVCPPLFEEGLAFAVLCDGMGGMLDGEVASSEVVSYLANRIGTLAQDEEIPAFFANCASAANERICAENQRRGRDAGTTLVSVILRGSALYWLSVGDSRIYLVRKGEMVQVSRDHKFSLALQSKVQAGEISQQQADCDPRRDALISYIGAPMLERVDINPSAFIMQHGDIVLLCSDGLSNQLTDRDILRVLARYGEDITGAAQALPQEAFERAECGMDNTTVVLLQYLGFDQSAI